jgi:hypothetical protein
VINGYPQSDDNLLVNAELNAEPSRHCGKKGPFVKSKLILTLLTVGAAATVGTVATFSAFTSTTSNTGNSFASGTVDLDDSDGGTTPLYVESNKKPGDFVEKCIRVSYLGSLAATVKLYTGSTVTNPTLFNLKIERGSSLSGAFPGCAGFAPAADLYTGTLGNFASTHNTYANGIDAKGSAWAQNNTVDYRFTVTQNDDPTVDAHTSVTSSGLHNFTWEAHSS